jgi:hypothetical protein
MYVFFGGLHVFFCDLASPGLASNEVRSFTKPMVLGESSQPSN